MFQKNSYDKNFFDHVFLNITFFKIIYDNIFGKKSLSWYNTEKERKKKVKSEIKNNSAARVITYEKFGKCFGVFWKIFLTTWDVTFLQNIVHNNSYTVSLSICVSVIK